MVYRGRLRSPGRFRWGTCSRGDPGPIRTSRRSEHGSHLDSQPTGGKFDGVYGVLAGLEVVRTLNDHGIETKAPVEVAVWTNEEGSRFSPAMVGSGVFAGAFDLEYGLARKDLAGKTLGEELERIGYNGDATLGHQFGAFFEVHIEQGPILENEAKTIGVVTGAQGTRWYDVSIVGAESHAGPTPMELRQDAMATATQLMPQIYDLAHRHAPHGRATIGEFRLFPGSRNTVPGTVEFSVDLRHPDADTLEVMHRGLHQAAAKVAEKTGLGIEVVDIWHSPPVAFDPRCVEAVRKSAELMGFPAMPVVSGAGHDSIYISRVAPTGMVVHSLRGWHQPQRNRECHQVGCRGRSQRPTARSPGTRSWSRRLSGWWAWVRHVG